MILHKFASSPYSSNAIVDSIPRIKAQDGILLTLDAVYCSTHDALTQLLEVACNVYVLKDDMIARGVRLENPQVKQIDYNEFVKLVAEYDSVIAWD